MREEGEEGEDQGTEREFFKHFWKTCNNVLGFGLGFYSGGGCQGRRAELPENPNEEWEQRTEGVSHRVWVIMKWRRGRDIQAARTAELLRPGVCVGAEDRSPVLIPSPLSKSLVGHSRLRLFCFCLGLSKVPRKEEQKQMWDVQRRKGNIERNVCFPFSVTAKTSMQNKVPLTCQLLCDSKKNTFGKVCRSKSKYL